MIKWIDVKEKLPFVDEEVLLYLKEDDLLGEFAVGQLSPTGKFHAEYDCFEVTPLFWALLDRPVICNEKGSIVE